MAPVVSNPAVSIVVPNHNRAGLLMQTLASVQAQTFADFECIVVDDHSTDDSVARIAPFVESDPRFWLAPSPRRGAQAARNTGIEHARGRYVILLDSDDLLADFCLAQRVPVMDANASLDFAVFPCECFSSKPGDTRLLWNIPTAEPDLDRFLKLDVPWQTTSPIWRREAILRLLPWPEDVPVGQDWEFHIRALLGNMNYARFGRADHYWRQPEAERDSIGKNTMRPEMLAARAMVNERVYNAVQAAGRMTDDFRAAFAGLFFQSAERVGTRISWRSGRDLWTRAHRLGLVSAKQHRQGTRYFQLFRFKKLRALYRRHLERVWPEAFFAKKSATYLKAPVDAPVGVAA